MKIFNFASKRKIKDTQMQHSIDDINLLPISTQLRKVSQSLPLIMSKPDYGR